MTAYKQVTKLLNQLTDRELRAIADMATGLVEAREADRQTEEVETAREELKRAGGKSAKAAKAAHGHIEYKTVNGCGPYKYLRYWSGKTLKSVYLGKA